jgi:hypothetical protein
VAIDNPLDAYEQQYMQDEPTLPNKLAKFTAEHGFKLAFPDGGLALDILLKVVGVLFDKEGSSERFNVLFELIKKEFEHVETTKASHEDVQQAILRMFWNDVQERNDAKRERYVKLIGNALRSEEQIKDVESFIQTIEQLNERDVLVLKVINKVMNKEGDWKPQPHPAHPQTPWRLHPSTLIGRRRELGSEVAMALGQPIERDDHNREEGYAICNRLQGFGLVHEIGADPRELPNAEYVFRLSLYGVRLLKLLGQDVANYQHYMQQSWVRSAND